MADKTYKLNFALSDGSTKSVQFTAPQGATGAKGDKGDKGDTGSAGTAGAAGKDGTSVTVKSVSESTADGGSNVVTFSDGSTVTIKNGSKGSTGAKGDKGDKGDTGATGDTGKTAYQYAQEGGYTETEAIFSQKLGSLETIIQPAAILVPGINLNDGVWEAGYFDATTGAAVTGTAGQSFRNANYLPVTGGRSIAIYYDAATWSGTNVYRAFYVVQYDSNKNFVAVSKHSGTGPHTPSGGVICTLQPNTAYIRISMNKWSALGQDLSTIKVAVYYVEDFVKEFVEYGYGSEATYGVASDKVFLTSPNGTLYALSVGDDGTLSVKLFGL